MSGPPRKSWWRRSAPTRADMKFAVALFAFYVISFALVIQLARHCWH